MDRLTKAKIRVPGLEVRVVGRCTSTNAVLLAGPSDKPVLLAAEAQSAGRGRRGRRWRSAPGKGATFSILRRMRCPPAALVGLPVAVGVAAARALRALGARGVSLKWPNDLMARRRKLGGILIETRSNAGGTAGGTAAGTTLVVGIGINCYGQPQLRARLGRGVAALEELLQRPVARNAVIGAVGRAVLTALADWEYARADDAPDPRLSARAA
jgi:BirA family biotin operon repressor/biotin-[acetyl-CoA-carboxylase] ligase